jgi:hypothetical protein
MSDYISREAARVVIEGEQKKLCPVGVWGRKFAADGGGTHMYALTRGGRFKYARTVLNQHGSQSMGEVYSATWISPSMISSCGVRSEKITSRSCLRFRSRQASISSFRKARLQYALNSHLVCHSSRLG